MRAAILDYGCGNLHSLAKAVASSDVDPVITADVGEAVQCDALFLPGVGAFGSATASLAQNLEQLQTALRGGLPCLGICLGMQLLFERSEEGEGAGLGVISGRVRRLAAERIPHMGWNTIEKGSDPLLVSSGLETAYFANSYVCEPDDTSVVTAWTTHESDRFPAAVRRGNIVGFQFHPEKSSSAGVGAIRAFLEEAAK
jgi:imidazole glycerol-phosphate synthase subunit HisH